MAIFPVCKMKVDEKTAKYTSKHGGKAYYFCAPTCKKAFDADPKKHLKSQESPRPHHLLGSAFLPTGSNGCAHSAYIFLYRTAKVDIGSAVEAFLGRPGP